MQEGDHPAACLREMASKPRLLAGELPDERAAASLRKPAEENDNAPDAAEERNELHRNQPPTG